MKHLIAVIVIIAIYAGSLLYKDQLLIEEKKIVVQTGNGARGLEYINKSQIVKR